MSKEPDKKLYIYSSGAKMGLALVVLLLILHSAGKLIGSGWTSLSWIVYIIAIYLTMSVYRDRYNNGVLSYGNGLLFGLKISTLSGIIVGFFYFILIRFIDPGVKDAMIALAEEAYLALGMPESQVEMMYEAIQMTTNPWVMLMSNALGGLINGAIVSLIVALVVQRKGDPFKEVMKDVEQ